MLERDYQAALIPRIKARFPGCVVLKNDSSYLQGIPDLLVLIGQQWAMLEVKASFFATYQSNQEYYLELLDNMSFAMMICPENEEEVLRELQQALRVRE